VATARAEAKDAKIKAEAASKEAEELRADMEESDDEEEEEKGVVGEYLPVDRSVELQNTKSGILRLKKTLTDAYKFFENVNVNDDGNFDIGDALSAAFLLEDPTASVKDVQVFRNNKLTTFKRQAGSVSKRKRTSKDSPEVQAGSYYLPWDEMLLLLTGQNQLLALRMICVNLISREVSPSLGTIAAIRLHFYPSLAFQIMNLQTATQRRKLITQMKRTHCPVVMLRGGPCSRESLLGQSLCSHHKRLLIVE
jgi:hypothetical protein